MLPSHPHRHPHPHLRPVRPTPALPSHLCPPRRPARPTPASRSRRRSLHRRPAAPGQTAAAPNPQATNPDAPPMVHNPTPTTNAGTGGVSVSASYYDGVGGGATSSSHAGRIHRA